uniref:Uncharacterized protein n=1 Tax=Meloidogyne javanica TaxID=6303 RepID=A0A915M8E8_MELJA
MSESSAKSVDECSCGDDERSCYSSEWKFDNCNDRIKILEVNKEKVGFAINLVNTKLDSQNQLLQQILFLQQQNFCKENSKEKDNVFDIQQIVIQQLEEKINCLVKEMNEQSELYNQQIKTFEEKIAKNNFENLKEIYPIQEKLLEKIEEKNNNKFSVKQKLIEELKEKLTSNENNVDSVQELIGEHSDKLKFLQTQVDVLQNHRDLFGRVDESYIKFGNRWGYVADTFAATQKVPINNNLFTNEMGTVKISGDQHVEYIPSEKAKSINNMIRVYGQFKFNKASAEPTCNSLFYFEVQFNIVKKQSEKVDMATIGVDSINGIVTFVSSMMPDNCTKC